jgi:hypothetical protein
VTSPRFEVSAVSVVVIHLGLTCVVEYVPRSSKLWNRIGQFTSLETQNDWQALSILDITSVVEIPTQLPLIGIPLSSRMCTIITVYKLADVLHALERPTAITQGRQPKYARMTMVGVTTGERVWVSFI